MRVVPPDSVLQPPHLLGGVNVSRHILVTLGLGVHTGLGALHRQREAVHHHHHVGIHL